MQLTISYKDGSSKVVNVHTDFFKDAEVRDRHKTTVVTPEQKAKDIALAGGALPYEILLMDGTEVVFREVNKSNKPERKVEKPVHEWIGFMAQDDDITEKEVKELRKREFTKKWNPRNEPMPWAQGINLLLGHVK